MELVTDFSQFEQGPSTRRVKSRSKACLHCRRRKMRCDGVKPSCFQCVRAERASECEYDDGITKTSTQLLYEKLAMLEKRYRDLQASKRPVQSRRAPSYSRANASPTSKAKDSNGNLVRSNSAPERVCSQPRVNGNGSYEQSFQESFTGMHDTPQSFGANAITAPPMPLDDTLYGQPFDLISSSVSSRSSTRSGRSTPSTSDFSHGDFAFHSRLAFAHDIQQGSDAGSPYIQPNSAMPMSIGSHTRLIARASGSKDAADYFQIPRKLAFNNSLDSVGELPLTLLQHFMDNFVAHSQQAGVTIMCNRLADVLSVAASRVSPGLSCIINSFLLWGCRFSNTESARMYEEHFLHEILSTLPSLLSDPLAVPPELSDYRNIDPITDGRCNIVLAISVSTVLATYFFSEGRALEGSYHANTASQLAVCAGLHHTPDPRLWRASSGWTASGILEVSPDPKAVAATRSSTDLLPLPNNLTSALERHHVFWNVFVLDRAWSSVGRLPTPSSRWSALTGEATGVADVLKDRDPKTSIATPWPEDWNLLLIDDPREETYASPPSKSTVEEFLTGADVYPTRSILQLRAKSTALFEAASRVAFVKDPRCDPSFATLQGSLSKFRKMLPPISSQDFRPPSYARSALYTIHTLTYAATIRLYSKIAEKAYKDGIASDPDALFRGSKRSPETAVQIVIDGLLGYERVYSQHATGDANADVSQADQSPGECVGMAYAAVDQCLTSAREITRIASCIATDDFSFLEPIVAPCWTLASEVLLRELKQLSTTHQTTADKANLLNQIRVLETSLKYLGGVFPIGNIEARKITSAMTSASDGNIFNVA